MKPDSYVYNIKQVWYNIKQFEIVNNDFKQVLYEHIDQIPRINYTDQCITK